MHKISSPYITIMHHTIFSFLLNIFKLDLVWQKTFGHSIDLSNYRIAYIWIIHNIRTYVCNTLGVAGHQSD